uniref:Uncharacterized protein n=1 Tax=Oryza punctata TaxID=4537 RepID=A0A0E0M5D1_ORYPU
MAGRAVSERDHSYAMPPYHSYHQVPGWDSDSDSDHKMEPVLMLECMFCAKEKNDRTHNPASDG